LQGSTFVIRIIVALDDTSSPFTEYIRLVECAYGFALAIDPVLGGIIADSLNWRWYFWMYETSVIVYEY
jgi:hypothetical protein